MEALSLPKDLLLPRTELYSNNTVEELMCILEEKQEDIFGEGAEFEITDDTMIATIPSEEMTVKVRVKKAKDGMLTIGFLRSGGDLICFDNHFRRAKVALDGFIIQED